MNALCKAKRAGARVTRYYAWSFMDNFEVCVCVCLGGGGRPRYLLLLGPSTALAQMYRTDNRCTHLAAPLPPLPTNPQWLQGYTERFGITHVDFATQARTVKASGRYLSQHFFKMN